MRPLGTFDEQGADNMVNWRLRGHVEPGMFPNERAFVVTDPTGNKYVVIVPVNLVDEVGGTVPVRVIHIEDDVALVNILGESASKTWSVSNSELVKA